MLPVQYTAEGAVAISYPVLRSEPLSLQSSIAAAFGSDAKALGIIVVKDLPPEFKSMRERLLLLANGFASLPEARREKYVDPNSRYSFGWSHGKEIMNGKPDTLKGSFYANPIVDSPTVSQEQRQRYPEYYGSNIWPSVDGPGVDGFEDAFKSLGRFIFQVGRELADACQPFAARHLSVQGSTLSSLISPQTTKARLLHYFPPPSTVEHADDEPVDSWCGFHLDHSLLTGLCSAIFLKHDPGSHVEVVSSPSPQSGLYIRSRGGELTKVSIPSDCLAFQTGEALEVATSGQLRATPHCVRVGSTADAGVISRETFALFMQPDTDQLIGLDETFGEFSKRIFQEHYG